MKQTSENLEKPKFPFEVRGPLVMIFDRVGVGAGGGMTGGRSLRWGGSLGPDGWGQLGARQRHQGPYGGRGTGGKMVGWGHWSGISDK